MPVGDDGLAIREKVGDSSDLKDSGGNFKPKAAPKRSLMLAGRTRYF